jgi:hypothetical protein
MKVQFEIESLEGTPAALVRRRRPGIEALPWGALAQALAEWSPAEVERERAAWTEGAFSEYASAAAFSALAGALLEARAPIELVGLAADFVVDEMLHVELNARVAMELGGAAPFFVDFAKLAPTTAADLSPFQRAVELALRISCIGEAMSVPVLVHSRRHASDPLTRKVLSRIVRDETPHAKLGAWVIDWATPQLDAAERTRLGQVGSAMLASYAPLWRDPGRGTAEDRRLLRRSVRDRVIKPMEALGIHLTADC